MNCTCVLAGGTLITFSLLCRHGYNDRANIYNIEIVKTLSKQNIDFIINLYVLKSVLLVVILKYNFYPCHSVFATIYTTNNTNNLHVCI